MIFKLRHSNADELAERQLFLERPIPASVGAARTVAHARRPEALGDGAGRGAVVVLAGGGAERLVAGLVAAAPVPAGRRRSGRSAGDAARPAAQQTVEVLAEARAHAVQRYRVDARVDVREHEADDLERVPIDVVFVSRLRVEVEPKEEDVHRQEAHGKQHHERLSK